MTKAKRKAPSRVKHELANPTVSCRVPKEVYDRLRAATGAKGMSFADALKVGLGLIKMQVAAEAKVRWQGHTAGHRKGYAEAEQIFKVTYPCRVCKKTLTVTSLAE